MVAAAWEERMQGLGRPAALDAAAPPGPQPPATRAVSDGTLLNRGAPRRPSASPDRGSLRRSSAGGPSPGRDRMVLRQLLDGVEAEHTRQLRGLREQLCLAKEQLAQALHGAGQGRPADAGTSAPVAPQSPPARAPPGCPPAMGQVGEGGGRDGGGGGAWAAAAARAVGEGPEKAGSLDEPLRGAAQVMPPPLPQMGRRQTLEVPSDNGTTNFHEQPVSTEGDDEEETRRPSYASASSAGSSSRNKTVKDQIVWQVNRGKTHERVVQSMLVRLLDVMTHGMHDEVLVQEKSKMNALGRWMNSTPVNHICCLVILFNAVCIGVREHVALRAEINQESVSETWEHLEWVFTAWFTAEILLRMLGERRLFYLGEDRGWNLMDTLLVISSLATLVHSSASASWTAMRMVRIFRLIRIFRAVKVVRSIQNFRIMIIAIFQSCGTLLWVIVVILGFQFFFAVLFMQGAVLYFKEEGLHSNDAEAIKDMFGDLFFAMLTLFESITGGRDWHEVVVALVNLGWGYAALFLLYIFFMTFLVLNVVVGGVVKTTSEVYKRDRNMIVSEETKAFTRQADEVKQFFRAADKDGSGTLSWDEFRTYLEEDDKVKAYFQSLDLEIFQAHMLFALLDTNEDDEVRIEEFIDGCMELKGQARTIDVKALAQQIKGLEDMTRRVNDKFDKLTGADLSRRHSRSSVRRSSASMPLADRGACSPSP